MLKTRIRKGRITNPHDKNFWGQRGATTSSLAFIPYPTIPTCYIKRIAKDWDKGKGF